MTEPEKKIIAEASFNMKMNGKAYGTNHTVFIDYDCKKYSKKTKITKVIVKKRTNNTRCYLKFTK